jgi:TrmH family RNA methyltransferase
LRLLTLARDLRRRKSRDRQELFVAEGVRAVEELLASGLDVAGILVAPQLEGAERGAGLAAAIRESGIETANVSEAEFRSAAETESPQGVLAIARIPRHSLNDVAGRANMRLLVLDGVQDPGNAGTMLRTAAALGVDATVALPGTVDLWNAKVVRGSMGASFRHPLLHSALDDLVSFCSANGIEMWGADTAGADVRDISPPERLALAVGNEGGGLSSLLRERVTRLVSIPLPGAVESLNVAVATGILLHQLRK